MSETDEQLVDLSLSDSKYFGTLISRYEDKLASFIHRRGKFSREDVEDILQNVFIKTYTNLNDFDTSLKFSSWIYRICYNELVSEYRRKSIREHVYLDEEENEHLVNFIKSELSVENIVHLEKFKKDFEEILNQLPDNYKQILTLRLVEEKDYTEISDILKMPVGTVSSLILRGKKILKENLKSYG